MEGREPMIRMYLNGVSVDDISKHFDCTRETVYRRLRTMSNFEEVSKALRRTRKQKRLKKYRQRLPEVYELLEQGIAAVNIAKQLGIPYARIRELLRGTKYDNTHESKKFRDRSIYSLYKSGMTQEKLAQKYDLGQSSISEIIKKWETSRKT